MTLQLPGKSMKSLLAGDLFDGRLPYGLHLVERTGRAGERCLEVADVVAGGTAAESSGLIRAGDQVGSSSKPILLQAHACCHSRACPCWRRTPVDGHCTRAHALAFFESGAPPSTTRVGSRG